jgi:tRNA (Thr-GGU) A37 N-methylase
MCPAVLLEIGLLRSPLTELADAPRQGAEGAPDAWLEIQPRYAAALDGVRVGNDLVVITWLHKADRDALQAHPRDDLSQPLTGVFAILARHAGRSSMRTSECTARTSRSTRRAASRNVTGPAPVNV